ncbi:MAG: TonB family protein, partial [Candidatus Eremiobacteraeota bacterium]|nr:TonB family protein [Candidatus Eremiobacteraeota bacterium]
RPTPIRLIHVRFIAPPPTPRPVIRPHVVAQHALPQAPVARTTAVRRRPQEIAGVISTKPGAFSGGPSSGAIDAGPSNVSGPGIPADPPPLESPPPATACAAPDIDARTIQTASLETPLEARQQGATGTVQVKVSLDADGAIGGASIYRSSGWAVLDQAALRAARDSTYRAEEKNCVPVAGSYLFTAQFEEP